MVTNEKLQEMIEELRPYGGAEFGIKFSTTKEIYELLRELQQRRESELRPATKYLKNTLAEQYRHIIEETTEVSHALGMVWGCGEHINGKEKSHLCEELIDLQTSCETMLAILGLDEQQRRDARKKVIEKNQARGYYDENTAGRAFESYGIV